jgi:hypothetical protein
MTGGYQQNPYYGWYEYGLVILLNARTILSLLGIVCIVKGTWQWNREWGTFYFFLFFFEFRSFVLLC